jgi:hypothetical protein
MASYERTGKWNILWENLENYLDCLRNNIDLFMNIIDKIEK